MGQRVVRFSDLSDALIGKDQGLARLVVIGHPALTDGPVQLEALESELKDIISMEPKLAIFDLYLPDGEPERIYMPLEAFDALATRGDMAEILASAESTSLTAKPTGGSGRSRDKVDYASSEHAGKPHRGKTTDEEKSYVREHLDEVNDRLAAEGLRTISLDDVDHVERYGLEDLARARGAVA